MIDNSHLLDILDVPSGAEHTHDPYGALCAMFDIANALYWLDPNSVPSHWGFRPGLSMSNAHVFLTADDYETSRDLLITCGIPADMLAWPYGQGNDPNAYAAGTAAEHALIELGNELNTYALLYRD